MYHVYHFSKDLTAENTNLFLASLQFRYKKHNYSAQAQIATLLF